MNRRTLISLFCAFVWILSMFSVGTSAFAEDYIPEILPVASAEGSLIDGEALKQFFDNYLHENYCDGENQLLSIALWYPGTDEYWYYNADEWMYGVNWYRLPVSMFLSEKVSKGELSMDSVVNGITLEYAVSTALEAASNPSASSMVIYLGGNMTTNCADLTKGYANLPDSYFTDEYYQENAYTARLMLEITKTLFLGGEERFPLVLDSMKKAMPEDFFKRDWSVRNDWEIAQTHAAYWGDGAGDRIHCTGIIYTPTPVVLTVMMKNIADLDILGGTAWHISHLAAELDSRQHSAEALSSNSAFTTDIVSSDMESEADIQQDASVPSSDSSMTIEQGSSNSVEVGESALFEQSQEGTMDTPSSSVEIQNQNVSDITPASDAQNPFRLILLITLVLILVVISVASSLIIREKRQQKRRRRKLGHHS